MTELQSMNITEDNISKLKSLFPEAFNEGSIDFDVLKQLLGENVDEKEERYGLNWHGKRQARQLALTPSRGTLRPCKDESVDWDNTKNLMIEGDNLEVLKLLQRSYTNKVKLIFIDPPYNTGRDFVYPDNFVDTLKSYIDLTGQSENNAITTTNPETNGRFHTDWLNMIYPRIKLSKNLLQDDGVLFISIDDVEHARLKIILDDIYGEENFIANAVWQSRTSISDDHEISRNHNHILVYAKNKGKLKFWGEPLDEKEYDNPDNDPRGPWKLVPLDANKPGGDTMYPVVNPQTGMEYLPPAGRSWAINRIEFQRLLDDSRIMFGLKGDSSPKRKLFLKERLLRGDTKTPSSLMMKVGTTKDGTKEVSEILGQKKVFDYPKPLKLIEKIISFGSHGDNEAIILDFFAGSGTSGHAVMNFNLKNGGNRRFILVQLPEKLDIKNKSQKISAEYCLKIGKPNNLSELTKERLRRAGKKVREDNPQWKGDVGFRVFKLDTSNISPWEATAENLSEQLDAYVSPILEGRSEEDLLTELMLKRGIDLSVNIETRQFDGLTVSCVDGGKLFTCFAKQIPASSVEELTKGIIDWHKSLKVGKDTVCYFLDDAFENNIAKTNLCAILEQHGLTNLHSL